MNITFSYDERFSKLMDSLRAKYSDELFDLEGIGKQLDLEHYSSSFFKSDNVANATIDSNANVRDKNAATYFNEIYKPFTKLNSLYVIWKRMTKLFGIEEANKFVEYEIKGALYLHDAHHSAYMPYCYAYSLGELVRNGMPFLKTIQSKPAKHLNTFIQHVIQFTMFASNQSSGAVGLPDFFVWMWYFVKKDMEEGWAPEGKFEDYIYQHFQILVYSFNQPIRSNQSPYTNFTYLDRNYIEAIFKDETYPDGTPIVEEIENIINLQKMFWKWIAKEREVQMFTFPVLTASLLYKNGKFVDEDSARFIAEVNMKWQDTNWYISDSIDAVASCCRLTSSTKDIKFTLGEEKLQGTMNSIGGSDLNIGSFKVLTVNLPQIALESGGDKTRFMELLRDRLEVAIDALAAIRDIIKERIEQDFLPLYTFNLMHLNRQYGTIGITGVFESASFMNMTEDSVSGVKYTKTGEKFVDKILDTIHEYLDIGFEKHGFTYNVEQVPAEKAAVTLAKKDRTLFGEKQSYELYSNQWLPLIAHTDPLNRIKYSGRWDKKVSGGAILHINIGSPFKNVDEYMKFVKMVADNGVIYFAFNQKISVCKEHHAFIGERCPICGEAKVDEYVRIVGYLVPRNAYNKVRRDYEFDKRVYYDLQ